MDLADALTESVDGYTGEPFLGAAPGGDVTQAVDVVGIAREGGYFYLVTRSEVPAEELKAFYVNDSTDPGVDTSEEAVEAARDWFYRHDARLIGWGEPVRNEAKRRWEIPVASRPLPTPKKVPEVLELPARDWKPVGWVVPTRTATCNCCGKYSPEMIMMFIKHWVPSIMRSVTDPYQVDLGHYAKRKGFTIEQARAEVEAEIERQRKRASVGTVVAKEPVHKRGWGIYAADGTPLLKWEVFPSRAVAESVRERIAALVLQDGTTDQDHQKVITDSGAIRVYDAPVQPLTAKRS
jgi:hypothetical protein